MPDATLDIETIELAEWLVNQGSERLWTVDGEIQIAGALSLPCRGKDLADLLAKRGGHLRVFAPAGASPTTDTNLAHLVDADDGLEVAWLTNGNPGDHWFVIEDKLAEEALGQVS